MKRLKNFAISIIILALLLVLGYGYYRYTDYYYGHQFYKECTITSEKDSYSFSENGDLSIPVSIDNHSRNSLKENNNYFLSYHLFDKNGKMVDADGGDRTPLSIDPFRTQDLSLAFSVPKPGSYQMVVDIVREGYYWYSDLGGETLSLNVTVE